MPFTKKLIPTKLMNGQAIVNDRLTEMVERESLLVRLAQAVDFPLVLVTAPAGYGKTTLVSQWVARLVLQAQQVVWFSVDHSDNDTEQFLHYFTAALAKITGISFDDLNDQTDVIDYLGQLLVKSADLDHPCYLIIDDYHLIKNEAIHNGLRFWLKHQPVSLHFILLSRLMPPLSMTNFRLHGNLLEIDAPQLAFNSTETRQFFELKLQQPITMEQGAALCECVEGWAAGAQLMAFAIMEDNSLLDNPEKWLTCFNSQQVADYLNEEVFCAVSFEMQQFMQRCAILRVMNEKLVVAVTGDENGIKKLDELENMGLFITRIPQKEGQIWWKFHTFIARYLAQRCYLTLPNEWQILHKRAALAWLMLGESSEALCHAQKLDDSATLCAILQQYGWVLFHQGQLKLLEECLQRLPQERIWQDENIVLLKAWLVQSQHRYQEVAGILQKFELKVPLTPSLQGCFDALKAQVAINAGNDEQAYLIAKQALKNLSSEFSYAQIVATSVIGEAQHCRGYLKEALSLMQQVEKMAMPQRAYHHWLWSKLQQAEILSAQGFWQPAYDLLKETALQTKAFHPIPMNEFMLRLQGQILWEWYDLDESEAMANAGIEMLEKEEDQVQCLTLLAKISLTRGDLKNAERLIMQCRNRLVRYAPHRDWLATFDEVQLLYWQMTNQTAPLVGWLAQAYYPEQEHNHFMQRQWRNIARCLLLEQRYDEALKILNRLLRTGEQLNLVSDRQRALILRNRLYTLQAKYDLAQRDLIYALNLSKQTNFISAFVIEGDLIAQQIRQLLQLNVLDDLTLYKTQFILRSINQFNRHKTAHFDQKFVANLIENPQMPTLLKISPLTQREWQVLGLIYSGYSNEQISQELLVAMTTIKTHIRNIYQKIGVSHRAEAIEYTRNLLKTIGYC